MSELTWTPDIARLDSLELWQHNPKWMPKQRAERLLQSWRDMGQYQTLACGPGGEVYDGNQRVKVLIAAGYAGSYEMQVLRASRALTDDERRRVILESSIGTVGAIDWDAIAAWDNSLLQGAGLDAETLALWNDDAAQLATLLTAEAVAPPEDPGAQVDKAEELQEKWQVNTGDVWLDPFCGSGTTIVAAHNEGRRGLGIEKLEKYVSVILERLAGLGLQPVRLG